MRALKILVIVMAVLLVGGSAALVTAIIARVGRAPPAGPSAALERVGPVSVALPPGARIAATELSGDRVLVRVLLAEGGEELMLFDAQTGAPVATIELRAAVPAAEAKQ